MERFMIYIYQNIHKLKQVFNTLIQDILWLWFVIFLIKKKEKCALICV